MRGCFAAVLLIGALFVLIGALLFGAALFGVRVTQPVAEVQNAVYDHRVEQPYQSAHEHAFARQAVVMRGSLLSVIALLLLVPAGLIILLVVLARACHGGGARVQCERSKSVEQMRTLEELRAGIGRMATRVESLETILLSAQPGRQ